MKMGKFITVCLAVLIFLTGITACPVMAEAAVDKEEVVTVTFAGDCSLGKINPNGYSGTFDEYYDKYGPSYFFKNVKPYFDRCDMTMVNLECVLSNSWDRVEKSFNIEGRPEFVSVLNYSGIDCVGIGNNHIDDFGPKGKADTINALESIGMPYALDEKTVIYNAGNRAKIGVVAMSMLPDWGRAERVIGNDIASLKAAGCNLVFVYIHWGEEMNNYPGEHMRNLGRKCIDAGADLVVGSHPHVLQGIEYYNGSYIVYSLANFCYGGHMNPPDKDTMMVMATFTLKNGKRTQTPILNVIPCSVSSVKNRNDYCPTPLTGKEFMSVIDRLNTYSSRMHVFINSQGTVIPVVNP